MRIAANKPDAMSRIPFAERYARECGSVPVGTPYAVAANDGAARKRPPIKIIPTAIRADRTKPMFVAMALLLGAEPECRFQVSSRANSTAGSLLLDASEPENKAVGDHGCS